MRNPDRINPFLEEIAKVWRLNPDLRFGQLIENVMNTLYDNHLDYIEDDQYLREFKAYYNYNTEDIDNGS